MSQRQRLTTVRVRLALAAIAYQLALTCGGCNHSPVSSDQSQLQAAMKLLGLQYGGYVSEHQGAAPPTRRRSAPSCKRGYRCFRTSG